MKHIFGIDRLLSENPETFRTQRCALVGHPASVTADKRHSLDALIDAGVNVVKAFGPQHGMRGDKQDNMVESGDFLDPRHGIPVISLDGEHRRPTDEMLADVDMVLFDLQDIGCRIYTYITTLKYFLEACTRTGTAMRVLDRPNPAGRPVDGLFLEPGAESFVGCDELPVRHGLTVGELALWLKDKNRLELDLDILPLTNWDPEEAPGFGWPLYERPWVNPSPNAASLNMARCFPGTVLIEGTTLSEGRGTTTPLEVVGAPELDPVGLLAELDRMCPDVTRAVYLRPCFFEPTFHKHKGTLCNGLQIHTDFTGYDHGSFKPFRLVACLLKALRQLPPDYDLWRRHEYEYEPDRLAIDVINGSTWLREWVDDSSAGPADLFRRLDDAESSWLAQRRPFLRYPAG
ncbi:MAG: DUF1343 domain-containing protein [Pseudomonadales bacterium]|nr:DUF1343 domain-containing protein [Pseudomonadales bacterium]